MKLLLRTNNKLGENSFHYVAFQTSNGNYYGIMRKIGNSLASWEVGQKVHDRIFDSLSGVLYTYQSMYDVMKRSEHNVVNTTAIIRSLQAIGTQVFISDITDEKDSKEMLDFLCVVTEERMSATYNTMKDRYNEWAKELAKIRSDSEEAHVADAKPVDAPQVEATSSDKKSKLRISRKIAMMKKDYKTLKKGGLYPIERQDSNNVVLVNDLNGEFIYVSDDMIDIMNLS